MQATPHTHQLTITDHGYFWGIRYGDQHIIPTKITSRWFGLRSEEAALKAEIRKIIRRHDRASQKAGASEATVSAAHQYARTLLVPQRAATDPSMWPSEKM